MSKIKKSKPLPKMEPPPIQPLSGYVCAQYVRCGKKNCRCAGGKLHGPYYYHFWREDGRLYKSYVKKADVAKVRAECQANRELQVQIRAGRAAYADLLRQSRALLRSMRERP